MTYKIQHNNIDGKNYVYRNSSGSIKILYTPEIVTSGLVVHLDSTQYVASISANNTWYDLSGNNNNAKLYNGVTYDGKFFVFDGLDEYAEIQNSSSINNCLNSDFTYEAWVYLQTGGNLWGKVFSKGAYVSGTGAFNGLTHYLPGCLFWQYMSTGGSSVDLFYSTPIVNQWIQLVYTRTSGVIKFYRDGVLRATSTNSTNFRSNYNFRIAGNSSITAEPSKQKVMTFRQYDKGLSAAEVLQNYNASLSKTISAGFISLSDPYDNRSFVAFDSSEISKINFDHVFETDETSLRKSEDGSLTFVKWTGSTPSFVESIVSKQSVVNYSQISSDVNNSTWSEQQTYLGPDTNPYPYSYFYYTSADDSTVEW